MVECRPPKAVSVQRWRQHIQLHMDMQWFGLLKVSKLILQYVQGINLKLIYSNDTRIKNVFYKPSIMPAFQYFSTLSRPKLTFNMLRNKSNMKGKPKW